MPFCPMSAEPCSKTGFLNSIMSTGADSSIPVKDMMTGILLSICLFIISVSSPLLSILVPVFLPFPVLFYRLKLGRKHGAVILAVSLGLVLFFTRGSGWHIFDVLICTAPLLSGFFLGEFIENHLGIEKLLSYTCLATIGVCAAFIAVHGAVNSKSMTDLMTAYLAQNLEPMLAYANEFIGALDIEPVKKQQMLASLTTGADRIGATFPAAVSIMLMTVVWFNILMIRKVLAWKHIEVRSLKALNAWRIPPYMLILVPCLTALLFFPVTVLNYLGINALLFVLTLYIFQGMAIVSYFFKRKGLSSKIHMIVFIAGIVIFQFLFLFLVMMLGVFDTWFNFRRLDTAGNSPKQMLP